MALITKLENTASITFGGKAINSNATETLLLLAPTIIKAVDKPIASLQDTLTYTVTITNVSATAITNLPFADAIPAGAVYITDSFKVNSTAVTPTLSGNTLSYTIPTIGILGTAVVEFKVTVVGGSS